MADEVAIAASLRRERKSRSQFLRWLRWFESQADDELGASVFAPPVASAKLLSEWRAVEFAASDLRNGVAFLTDARRNVAVAPPFPFEADSACAEMDDLRAHWLKPRKIALALLRLGHYAVGVFEDGRAVYSKAGSRYVKGKHKKGGQSAMRFTRNRQAWIDALFDEFGRRFGALATGELGADLDAIFLGGDKIVVKKFLKQADLPPDFAARVQTTAVGAAQANSQALGEAADAALGARMWFLNDD